MIGGLLLVACTSLDAGDARAAELLDLLPLDRLSLEPAADPVPYGFWGLNGYVHPEGLADVRARLGATTFQVAAANPAVAVHELLPTVRAAGMSVTLRMTGNHDRYTTADGDFDLDAWKAALDPWRDSGVQAFIDDGTLAGHMLLDDIYLFEGADPTAAQLDELARYSRELLPGLMTFVRCRASHLPEPAEGAFRYLDAAVAQYKAQDGDTAAYVAVEAEAARRLDLGLIAGLNIADGGDGRSGQAGWRPGFHAMSAEEILADGAVVAQTPGLGRFLLWEYDGVERWSDGTVGSWYFDRPDRQAALAELGRIVAARPRAELRRELRGHGSLQGP